jgi:hypothetical protein
VPRAKETFPHAILGTSAIGSSALRQGCWRTACWGRYFGPKRDVGREDWKTLRNEELYDWCSSPHINRAIKSRIIRWMGSVARMGDWKGWCCVLWVSKKARNRSDDLSGSGKITLNWSPIKRMDGWVGGRGVNWIYVAQDRDKEWALWCGSDASGSKMRWISWLWKD